MGMSDLYDPADDAESLATIQAALDTGITLLDTGDFYGMAALPRNRGRDSARWSKEWIAAPDDFRNFRARTRCPAAKLFARGRSVRRVPSAEV